MQLQVIINGDHKNLQLAGLFHKFITLNHEGQRAVYLVKYEVISLPTSIATSSLSSSKRPILRTVCRTSSESCSNARCSSSTKSAIFPWTSREPTCSSSSLPGGMRRRLPFTSNYFLSIKIVSQEAGNATTFPAFAKIVHVCRAFKTLFHWNKHSPTLTTPAIEYATHT